MMMMMIEVVMMTVMKMAYRSDSLVDNLQMNLRDAESFQSIRDCR